MTTTSPTGQGRPLTLDPTNPDHARAVAQAFSEVPDGATIGDIRARARAILTTPPTPPTVTGAAEDLLAHIARILDDWAELADHPEQRNRELWTPLHRKADALRAALDARTTEETP